MNNENKTPMEEAVENTVEETVETAVEETAEDFETEEDTAVEEDIVAVLTKKEKKQKPVRSAEVQRRLRYGRLATLLTVAVVVLTILLNVVLSVVANRFPLALDFSADKTYSLSEESIALAKAITKPVEIIVFASEETFSNTQSEDAMTFTGGHTQVSAVLTEFYNAAKQYTQYSDGKVTFTYVDMNKNPNAVNSYASKYALSEALAANDILFTCEDRAKVANMSTDLFTVDYSAYYSTGSLTLESSNVEQALAAKIKSVQSEKTQVLTLFTGHSEDSHTEEGLRKIFELNGYDVEEVDLTRSTEINVNTVCGIIAAPTVDYAEKTIDRLRDWLNNDGKEGRNLLVFTDATASCPNLYEFLKVEYGIEVTDNVVVETDPNRMYAYYQDNVYGTIAETDFTKSCGERDVLSQTLRQIVPTWEEQTDTSTQYRVDLVTFNDTARLVPFEEFDKMTGDSSYEPEEQVYDGTIVGMTVAVKQGYQNALQQETETKVAVCGSKTIPYAALTGMSTVYNEDLLLDSMAAITGVEGSVNISAKPMTSETISFSTTSQVFVGLGLFTIVLPLGLMIAGLVIFLKRRHL